MCAVAAAAAAGGLMFVPAVRDEAHWRLARLRDTERAYRAYRKTQSGRRHGPEAGRSSLLLSFGAPPRPRIPDRLFWWWMRWDGSTEACQEYLEAWPKGRFREEAKHRLDRLRWVEAVRKSTVTAYQGYLDDVEEGAHRKEAEERQKELQRSDQPFLQAAAKGTVEAWAAFLDDFRGHRRAGEALARLGEAEPNGIFRLAREGELTISAQADLLYRLGVVLHKRQREALSLSVPRGLYLKARNPRVMDLVATHGFDDTLDQNGNIWCPTPAAGASMRKRLPAFRDKFTVLPTPPNEDLARLIAFFAFKMPEFRLRQGAIWIVTDNARWRDLKRHMYGQTGADRDIITGDEEKGYDPEEAINAILILEAAGLEVRRYAIWQKDRVALFWNLLALDSPEWRTLEAADPAGIGQSWGNLKARLGQRLASLDTHVTAVLRAKPFEVSITARPGLPEAAWLAWYLREMGHEVDFDTEFIPEETRVWTSEELPREYRAMAALVECAFRLRGKTESDIGIVFRRPLMDVSIAPMGTNDAEKQRKELDHTPKWLRWIP